MTEFTQALSKIMKELWNSPLGEKERELSSERMRQAWQNPDFREKW